MVPVSRLFSRDDVCPESLKEASLIDVCRRYLGTLQFLEIQVLEHTQNALLTSSISELSYVYLEIAAAVASSFLAPFTVETEPP